MKVIYGLTRFSPLFRKPVVALGIFDGLHRGHCRIIRRLIKEAKRLHTQSLVVTFYPHPQKEKALYSLPHRLKLLEELGVNLCLVIRFTPAFRRMPALEFVQRILVKKINPAEVFIGRNFTFGRHAEGNWQMLKEYLDKAGGKLKVLDVMTYKGKPISSSRIRILIRQGEFTQAEKLLGRPVTILGRVSRGWRFARRLGYPTANVSPEHEVLPAFGVYAVRVRGNNDTFAGICYIGNRPTIKTFINSLQARKVLIERWKALSRVNIEVHIFDFRGNLYGQRIQIEFIKRIRSQRRFSSISALASQIKRDIRNTTRN